MTLTWAWLLLCCRSVSAFVLVSERSLPSLGTKYGPRNRISLPAVQEINRVEEDMKDENRVVDLEEFQRIMASAPDKVGSSTRLSFRQIDDLFRKFDTSGDGLIDMEEMRAALTEAGKNPSQDELNDIFKLADKNPILESLSRIDKDMTILESAVGSGYRIPLLETSILSSIVAISSTSNYLFEYETVEASVPAVAAVSAVLSFASEYIGRRTTAEAQIVGNVVRVQTAEAAQNMARAINAKSIIPLCVTVATASSLMNVLIPPLLKQTNCMLPVLLKDLILIIWPILAVISCDVAELANIETRSVCRDIFSKKNAVGDLTAEVGDSKKSVRDLNRNNKNLILDFASTTFLSPIISLLCPGSFAVKCAVCSALATCQCTYYLSNAEWSICRGLDRFTLISRCATVSEAYANQGGRSLAVLPYTASLTALSAASSAAVVEAVPFIPNINLQALATTLFPVLGVYLAASASVGKARVEVDAAAATVAAVAIQANSKAKGPGTGKSSGRDEEGVLRPLRRIIELLRLTTEANLRELRKQVRTALGGAYAIN